MNYSPLRYPGGKSRITPLIRLIIEKTGMSNITYIEPFAGGAGVALSLLIDGVVKQIVINDYDKAIYSFWRMLKEDSQELIDLIRYTPLTIDEWKRQKEIYCTKNHKYSIELGFAAFYLNRTNRSGILNAGPIGGCTQNGKYKMNARFNRDALVCKIRKIVNYKSQITVYNKEIRGFISNVVPRHEEHAFVYFDPPYFKKGQRLYKNSLSPTDHADIAKKIITNVNCPWVITYDDEPEPREIYSDYLQRRYNLNYSVANKGKGCEIMIFQNPELVPTSFEISKETNNLYLAEV